MFFIVKINTPTYIYIYIIILIFLATFRSECEEKSEVYFLLNYDIKSA